MDGDAGKQRRLGVIKFTADWCGPCKACAPAFHALEKEMSDDAVFYEVNVQKDAQGATDAYRVCSLPTFVVLLDGVEVARVVGSKIEDVRAELHARKKKLMTADDVADDAA